MSPWLKKAIIIAGLLLALPGVPMLVALCCLVPLAVLNKDPGAVGTGIISLTLVAVTLGAGVVVARHGWRSLQGQSSQPLRLPVAWALAGIFGMLVAIGLFISASNFVPGLFFPPVLLIGAALPPLLAVSWFTHQQAEGLTWRRALVAFAGGATVSVVIAMVLEILIPIIVFALVLNLGDVATRSVRVLLDALAGKDIASAITNPGFVYVFVQIALIAPLAEEFAKPLVALPLLGRLTRRDAFWVGAMAGAGFATLENVLYAGFGYYFWAGILVVRAAGGAIHPLGAGLVGLSWRDILNGEPNAWRNGLARFGMAVGVHALWNGGSLLVITLAGARFFGQLPAEINVLGLSAAGTTLAFLIVLGLATLWMGRALAQRARLPSLPAAESADLQFTLSDRAVAIWALACLVAIVPAGITGLQLLVR
jgi:RsiW-degrading membrane proteinase PrsW (M82 family)